MSATVTDLRSSFNGGELSPRMEGRADTAIYQIGLSEMENFAPTIEGPAAKMPGTRYVRDAMSTSRWLIPFIYNRDQSYAIECGDLTWRFFTNDGRIETDPSTPYEVTVPYTAAEAPDLSYQQSYDRLYLAHSSHPPASLLRTGASTFTFAELALRNGPFSDRNSDETITVSASATTGSGITITASAAIFQAGHVGGLFRIEAKDFSDIPAWEVGIDTVTTGVTKVRNDGKVYLATGGTGRTGSVPPTHDEGTEYDGTTFGKDINAKGPYGVAWTYQYDRFGIVEITAVAPDGLSCTATVLRTLADSLVTVPSWRWTHGAFSDAEGWPNLVIIWKGRLFLIKNFDVYGSVSGDYLNFQQYLSSGLVTADLAFRRTISSADPILWAAAAQRALVIGTANAEYVVRPVNNAEALSGSNIDADVQSTYGAEPIRALRAGSKTIFVQRGGRKLREMDYDFARDRYEGVNITAWARHIMGAGAIQLAYQQDPEELIWIVRSDGVLAVHAFSPEQELKGFARRVLASNGLVLSAAALPAHLSWDDRLWLLIERDGVKSIEYLADWWQDGGVQADAFFVDSGVSGTLTPGQTVITTAQHLAGRGIIALLDGAVVSGLTVDAGGSFTLPATGTTLVYGLAYTSRLTTMRLEAAGRSGTSQGKLKKLVRGVLRVIDAGAGLFAGSKGGFLDELIRRTSSMAMDAPIPLVQGDTNNISIGGGWDTDGQITIEHNAPLPCIVTTIMPTFEVSER